MVPLPAGSGQGFPRWLRGLCMRGVVSCGSTSFPLACTLLRSSAVRVHDSQAYRKMDVTRERISRMFNAVAQTILVTVSNQNDMANRVKRAPANLKVLVSLLYLSASPVLPVSSSLPCVNNSTS